MIYKDPQINFIKRVNKTNSGTNLASENYAKK